MWNLITIGIIALLIILMGVFLLRKEKIAIHPMENGMAWGGIAGVIVGIALVEFWGYEYPVPAILWMLGMAGGQAIGWFYARMKK